MKAPASFGRFLSAACAVVGVVQVALLGFLALHFTLARVIGDRGMEPPAGFPLLNAGLSLAAVAYVYVQYRRGELDEYGPRRRR